MLAPQEQLNNGADPSFRRTVRERQGSQSSLSISTSVSQMSASYYTTPQASSSGQFADAGAAASPSTSRHTTTSTPSPVSSLVDEDEILGDEEMMQYIKKQQAKKLASGANQADLDNMLRFPEPIEPAAPVSPAGKSSP